MACRYIPKVPCLALEMSGEAGVVTGSSGNKTGPSMWTLVISTDTVTKILVSLVKDRPDIDNR